MSADNFFELRRHPKGGFALVMGFASDEDYPGRCEVRENAKSFETIEEALKAYSDGQEWPEDGGYPEYYCEYGLHINPECFQPTKES